MLNSSSILQNIDEKYKYDVRVSENKIIHDSFKGILRISPNNGVDDPSDALKNSIVRLTDSDGNILPISFSSTIHKEMYNIHTDISGNTYISNKFIACNGLSIGKLKIFETVKDNTFDKLLYYDFSSNNNNSNDDIIINGRLSSLKKSNKKVLVGDTTDNPRESNINNIGFYEKDVKCTHLRWFDIEDKIIEKIEELSENTNNDVQTGSIIYHAMPFHRYWFHRCRQVLANIEKQMEQSEGYDWEDMDKAEYDKLLEYKDNKTITACSNDTLASIHSLAKDYLICNGKEVDLCNFPNINLKNTNLFWSYDNENDTKIEGQDGDFVKVNTDTNKYEQKDLLIDSDQSSIYYNLCLSNRVENDGDINKIKLPNLFAISENYPRYIRGYKDKNSKPNELQNWSYDFNNYDNGSHYHLLFAKESGSQSSSNNVIIGDTTTSEPQNCYVDNEFRILFSDKNITKENLKEWANYCLNDGKETLYFAGFQPIPTIGNLIQQTSWNDYSSKCYMDVQGNSHRIGLQNKETVNKKIKESESAYPISREGCASFLIKHETKTYKHVGKYFLHGISKDDIEKSNSSYIWRTMTSLPIMNCDKLGVGDMSKSNAENICYKDTTDDYYIKNSVTDVLDKDKSLEIPKTKLQYDKDNKIVYDDSPHPSTLNLLPLIRL